MKGKRKVKTDRKRRGQERGEKEQSKRKGRRDKEQLKGKGTESICGWALLFEQMVIAKVPPGESLISLLASVVQLHLFQTKI